MNGPWRVGRKLGRTLYIQAGKEPDCGEESKDVFVGIMDTAQLARDVRDAMNHWFRCDCLEDCAAAQGYDPAEHPLTLPEDYYPPQTTMDDRGKVTTTYDPVENSGVLPDDDGLPVVAVDSDSGIDGVPEDGGPVLAPPPQADLPVVPLDALGDDAGTGDT